MICETVTLPGGQRAIVCSSGSRARCASGARAPLLCDWKVPSRKKERHVRRPDLPPLQHIADGRQGSLPRARAGVRRVEGGPGCHSRSSGMKWGKMTDAPRNGVGLLAYGCHDRDDPPGAARGVKAGDHWWAILLWDVWRPAGGWVFAKDGHPAWSDPLAWAPLEVPEGAA